MFQRKPRRFRRRSNHRGGSHHANGHLKQIRPHSFSNDHTRNKFKTPQSAERLFEKYNTLAKEAMSTGDKTLSENYLQHADHFARIIEDKNKNQSYRKTDPIQKQTEDDGHLTSSKQVNHDQPTENKE